MRKKLKYPLGGRYPRAERNKAARWLVGVWGGRTRPAFTVEHAVDLAVQQGAKTANEIISRADMDLRSRYGRMGNPPTRRQITEETMLGEGGQLVEPLSESGELTFVIEILMDALSRGIPAGSYHDVAVAVRTLRRLKEQVMHGYHRNPGQSGGVHIDIASHNPRRRRPNPPMVILGANPPGTSLRAKWARIEYCRPDDPEGKRVARVHDFPDGFVAHGLADGSVILRHPKGRRLWTRR